METATLVTIFISGLLVSFAGMPYIPLSTTKRSFRGTRRLVEVMSLPILEGSLLQLK